MRVSVSIRVPPRSLAYSLLTRLEKEKNMADNATSELEVIQNDSSDDAASSSDEQLEATNDFLNDAEIVIEDEDGNIKDLIDEEQTKPEKGETEKELKNDDSEPETTPDKKPDDEKKEGNDLGESFNDLFSEDGSLDFEKAVDLVGKFENGESQQATTQQTANVDTKQDSPADDIPYYQKAWDENKAQRETIEKSYFEPLNRMAQYLTNRGLDQNPDISNIFNTVYRETQDKLKSVFTEMDLETNKRISEEMAKASTETANKAKIEAESSRNLNNAYQQLGGQKKFGEILFNPKIAGNFLLNQYEQANPDKLHLKGKEANDAFNSWYVKHTSNPKNVQVMVQVGQAMLQAKLMPQMLKQYKTRVEKEANDRRKSQMAVPKNTLLNQGRQRSSGDDLINDHFYGGQNIEEV